MALQYVNPPGPRAQLASKTGRIGHLAQLKDMKAASLIIGDGIIFYSRNMYMKDKLLVLPATLNYVGLTLAAKIYQ